MSTPNPDLAAENAELRARLEEAEETLRAIRAGEVDALVMGEEVYTLKGAETPYRLLIEAMNEGAATVTRDGTVLYCNQRFAQMAGTTTEQIIGSCLCERVLPAHQPALRALVAGALHIGARAEFNFSSPNGPGLPFQLSLRPLHKDAETIAVVAADLSERKRHEAELRQLNQELEDRVQRRTAELQAILDTAPIGLAIAQDPEGRHIRGNPANEKMYGLERGEELSRRAAEPARYRALKDGRELPVDQLPMQRAVRGETVIGQIMDVVRTDGRRLTVYCNAAPLLDEQHRPCGAVGAFLDISELKRAEEAVAAAHGQVQSIINNTTALVYAFDLEERFLLVNTAVADLLNSTPERMIGKRRHEFMPKEDADWHEANDRQVIEAGKALEFEEHNQLKGRSITWLTTKFPLRDAQRRIYAVAGISTDVSERKQAEEALRQSEALALSEKEFRLLAEAMPQIVWATRADGWNTYFNQQWVDYTGLTLEESYGHGWNKPFHPDDQQRAWDAWQNAVTNRATYALECRLRRADGTYRWWLIRGVPVLDEKGSILKWFGTCTDINDLKEAEKVLREAGEERLRLALEATSMGTFEVDLRTGEGRWNTVEFELLGLKPGDAPSVPATFFRYLHPDDAARVRAQWAEATQTGILNMECRIVRADGQVRWLAGLGRFAYAGKPEDSAPGGKREPERFLGVNFDITERKQIETALRESESRYRAIGESIDYGVWVCAPDGRNIYASPSFLKLVGLTQEQCSNFGWGDVLHPDDTARTVAAWKECVRTGAKWDIEHRFRGVDGKYHPVLARGVPVQNDKGEVVCWVGINLDISRLKEAEEGVRRHAEELRATNEELNRFNEAMVGRELRMIELKQEIDALCAQLGQPPRYGPLPEAEAKPEKL